MKLQINQRGSWRDVVEFDDDPRSVDEISFAACHLAKAVQRAKWRIVADKSGSSPRVVAYCEAPGFTWVKP